MKSNSLFQRLFFSIFIMLLLLFAVGGFLVLSNTSKRIGADYDAQLIADSYTVWSLVREDLEEGDDLGELHLDFNAPMLNDSERQTLALYGRWRAVRIWHGDKLAAQSENIKYLPAVMSAVGFSNKKIQDDWWRVYTVFIPDNKITVEIYENLRNRHQLMLAIAKGLIEPGLIILPLLILLLLLAIRYGIRSLVVMAQEVRTRRPEDLSPLQMTQIPREIFPLYHAINMLLARIKQGMEHEREFMNNVAHELKTPLAALRLQGELIAKAPTQNQQQECVEDLLKGIDRATYLFEQIRMFSRLSQAVDLTNFAPLSVIEEVIAQRLNIAMAKKIEISLEAEKDVILHSNPELLAIMLGALLDNALKYTPENGSIVIALQPKMIVMTDSGMGIALEDRQRVFARFSRGRHSHHVEGSGLGLSIVQEICQQLGVSITLDTPEKHSGLKVVLGFR